MKKNIIRSIISITFFTSIAFSQEIKKDFSVINGDTKLENTLQQVPADQVLPVNAGEARSSALTTCTDMVNYVGNTSSYRLGVGPLGSSSNYVVGVFQVFPAYTGAVKGVQFNASKRPNASGNSTALVAIFPLSGSVPSISSQTPNLGAVVTVTSTTNTLYTVNFPSQIPVSNGFAVGIYTSNDSVDCYISPFISNTTPYNSYVFLSQNSSMYNVYYVYSQNFNFLIRPIITTSVNPSWTSARTSTGCALPVVYDFSNTTPSSPSWMSNTKISPSGLAGITKTIDFGDGFNNSFNYPQTHSYTAVGDYTATYVQSYSGWTGTCSETLSTVISVENPQPSFTYTVNGLVVNFSNTSQNLNNFIWNFGDLQTSTQVSPQHIFTSPGTYVVELEGTASCGKVRYTANVVIASDVAVREQTQEKKIEVFPNPVKNTLILNNKGKSELYTSIQVVNTLGSVVKTIENKELVNGSNSVDVSFLPQGVYFIKFNSGETTVVRSFIKE